VYSVEEVTLQDGREVTLKPLNIKGLRKFMQKMGEFQNIKEDDEGMEILLDAAAICLMKEHPDLWDKNANEGKGGASEDAAEVFDLPTIYRVLDICGGVKLDDPNLIAAAMESIQKTPGND